jgi:hypothetical protein
MRAPVSSWFCVAIGAIQATVVILVPLYSLTRASSSIIRALGCLQATLTRPDD